MKLVNTLFFFFIFIHLQAQSTFDYQVQLTPINIPNMPGIHSFAHAQHNNKWVIIGGRLDGIHARQPFNAFPSANNNTTIYVIDSATQQLWSASVNSLATGLREQLQATNFNFFQDNDTLYIAGGYAFSASANDHKTFDNLTSISVSGLIDAIITGNPIASNFKQISNPNLAITGGYLGKIGTTFYLIGGHRFDGRYNPMNNPTFTQTYSSQIRKFTIDNSGTQLSISNYEAVTDAIHLHRRDYNLVPQVFPNGELGYTISSGVFQIGVDLPFLYPVDVKASGYVPQTSFNQYLSNYHSATAVFYDATENRMHSLFFGGISQYYYNGTTLVQDNSVPFVNTISRVTRFADGTLQEYQLPQTMPGLKGASAEFIQNKNLPHYENEVVKLNDITANEFVVGHIVGGIASNSSNPFNANQTNTTSANPTIYEVKLIKNQPLGVHQIDGKNPFKMMVSPNPAYGDTIKIKFTMAYETTVDYYITSIDGKIIDEGSVLDIKAGENTMNFPLDEVKTKAFNITFIFDNKFYISQKVIMN